MELRAPGSPVQAQLPHGMIPPLPDPRMRRDMSPRGRQRGPVQGVEVEVLAINSSTPQWAGVRQPRSPSPEQIRPTPGYAQNHSDAFEEEEEGGRAIRSSCVEVAQLEEVQQDISGLYIEIEAVRDLHTKEIGRFILELGDFRTAQQSLADAVQKGTEAIGALHNQHNVLLETVEALKRAQATSAKENESLQARQGHEFQALMKETSKCFADIELLKGSQSQELERLQSQLDTRVDLLFRELDADLAKLRDEMQQQLLHSSMSCEDVQCLQLDRSISPKRRAKAYHGAEKDGVAASPTVLEGANLGGGAPSVSSSYRLSPRSSGPYKEASEPQRSPRTEASSLTASRRSCGRSGGGSTSTAVAPAGAGAAAAPGEVPPAMVATLERYTHRGSPLGQTCPPGSSPLSGNRSPSGSVALPSGAALVRPDAHQAQRRHASSAVIPSAAPQQRSPPGSPRPPTGERFGFSPQEACEALVPRSPLLNFGGHGRPSYNR